MFSNPLGVVCVDAFTFSKLKRHYDAAFDSHMLNPELARLIALLNSIDGIVVTWCSKPDPGDACVYVAMAFTFKGLMAFYKVWLDIDAKLGLVVHSHQARNLRVSHTIVRLNNPFMTHILKVDNFPAARKQEIISRLEKIIETHT